MVSQLHLSQRILALAAMVVLSELGCRYHHEADQMWAFRIKKLACRIDRSTPAVRGTVPPVSGELDSEGPGNGVFNIEITHDLTHEKAYVTTRAPNHTILRSSVPFDVHIHDDSIDYTAVHHLAEISENFEFDRRTNRIIYNQVFMHEMGESAYASPGYCVTVSEPPHNRSQFP